MALRIIKSTEAIRVENLILCVYSPPGVGKSSLGFTADAPLLLDFDQGAHRAANRKDSVRVSCWDDAASITAEELEPYNTIVVDTAGRALDHLTADIIRRNSKLGGKGGVLSLQGYGALKGEFNAWLKQVRALGKDIVLIAHMDEQRSGDEISERIDMQGGSKAEVYKSADAMARLMIRDGKRILNFSPTDTAFGKNPGRLDPLVVPHPDKAPTFLADVIQSIKDRLNEMTAEQTAAQVLLEGWRTRIGGMKTADDFNGAMAEIKTAAPAVRTMFVHEVAQAGFIFDKAAGAYIARPEVTEPAAAE